MKLKLDISEANSYIKRILTNDPILYNLRVKGILVFKVIVAEMYLLVFKR